MYCTLCLYLVLYLYRYLAGVDHTSDASTTGSLPIWLRIHRVPCQLKIVQYYSTLLVCESPTQTEVDNIKKLEERTNEFA